MSAQVNKMFPSFSPNQFPEQRRQLWGRLFGLFIQGARNETKMSVEEAAGVSGMTVSEWMAIEQGHVPLDINRLRAISATLELTWDRLVNMLAVCREAWTL